MGPEMHYQLILNRVAELQEEASSHRKAREARAAKKSHEQESSRRVRAGLGKFRTS